MSKKLTARACKIMREAVEDELALQVAHFEYQDAEMASGRFNIYSPPDPEQRVKTLNKLLFQLRQIEKQENAHARR